MITCKKCGRFAEAKSIIHFPYTDEVKDFKVKCSRCGIIDGNYDDFSELPFDFVQEQLEAKEK